ncbi:MAG: hypothetical protein HVN34_08925 [Methanobacteriaceae archaeon]|jgi:hypothetical protein|nr:hypothetical protein [Methanobacteriaceae archaeon]OPY20563.1 MAG: hypothetical protein A4E26_01862 [Methanobacterium sp. PtaU1.Bin097]
MVETKEIKSIELTPFAKMSATIYAILAFIVAIIAFASLAILQVANVFPGISQVNLVAGVGLPLLVILPVVAFFGTLVACFVSAFLYNTLVPRLGGIELEFDGIEVTKIPVVPFALIQSAIVAIWAFIAGLFLAGMINIMVTFFAGVVPAINNEIPTFNNTTFPLGPTGMPAGMDMVIISLLLIIGLPILLFVFGFIYSALYALVYNYLASRVAKIKLEFVQIAGNLHELKHIPVVQTALALAIVSGILGFIDLLMGNGDPVSSFISQFIMVALVAILYNYLAPKIGAVKLELE